MTDRVTDTKVSVLREIQENRNHSWMRELIRDNRLADKIFATLEKTADYESFASAFPELSVIVFKYFVDNDIRKSEFVWNSFQWARLLKSFEIAKGTVDKLPQRSV